MKPGARDKVSRRALSSLLLAVPAASQTVRPGGNELLDRAMKERASHSEELKTVALEREIEPSFRFEP